MRRLFKHKGPKQMRPDRMVKLFTLGYLLGNVRINQIDARLIDSGCDIAELQEEYYTLVDEFVAPYIKRRKHYEDSSDDSDESSSSEDSSEELM